MKNKLKAFAKFALPAVVGAITLTAASTGQATLIIDETFTGANGTLPANWTRIGTVTDHVGIQGNRLRLYRSSTAPANGNNVQATYYTGTGLDGSLTNGQIADFRASFTLNTGNIGATHTTTSFGLIARNNTTGFSVGSNGYYIGLLAGNTLGIWNNVGTNNNLVTPASALNFDTVSLSLNTDYILEVLANGVNISASLWAVDLNGEKVGTALGEVGITNAKTDAGYLGFRMGPGNSNVSGYVDNFQVHSIPEPATALLLLPAAAFLIYRKRRVASRH